MQYTQSEEVEKANAYISAHKAEVNDLYRGNYHLNPEVGWMNDPNGFIYFKGRYHLFYQNDPFHTENVLAGWSHAVSDDLITWEHLGAALRPDHDYDADGCWSGSAVEKDGRLYLLYTGHYQRNGIRLETQNLAWSDDGVVFHKYEGNPVIGPDMLPEGTSSEDFRDPYVWKNGNTYYMLVGTMEAGAAKVLLFRSEDLFHWEFFNTFLRREGAGYCWECPNLVPLGDTDLFVVSPVDYPHAEHAFHNYNSTVYALGEVLYGSGKMSAGAFRELDYGIDFYAPQLIPYGENKALMVGWMNMWGRSYPTSELGHGWTGTMTLPRILTVRDGAVYQRPVEAIDSYFVSPVKVSDVLTGSKTFQNIGGGCIRLKVKADLKNASRFSVNLFEKGDVRLTLSYDKAAGIVTLDRSHGGVDVRSDAREISRARLRTAPYSTQTLELDIFLDRGSAEIFFGEGELVMSSLVFNGGAEGISFSCEGSVPIELEQRTFVKEVRHGKS